MEIETLNAMNDGMYLSLMMLTKLFVVIAVLSVIAGLATYLAGVVWLCFEETRRSKPAQRTARRASPQDIWKSVPRVPNTQLHTSFVNKPRSDARAIASRPCEFLAGVAPTPPA